MTQRLKTAGLLFAILVFGMGIIVAATEYEAGADGGDRWLLTASDVVAALDAQGLDIDPARQPAHHPLLGTAGTTLSAGSSAIEVYVYPDVATRVADEQVIQRHILQLQAMTAGESPPLRVTSAHNVLLLFYADSSQHAAAIHAAAHSLASALAR